MATNHVWHPMSGKLRLYESSRRVVLRFARRIVAVSREIKRRPDFDERPASQHSRH